MAQFREHPEEQHVTRQGTREADKRGAIERQLAKTDIANGELISDVQIPGGVTFKLAHRLGRAWRGYFLTRAENLAYMTPRFLPPDDSLRAWWLATEASGAPVLQQRGRDAGFGVMTPSAGGIVGQGCGLGGLSAAGFNPGAAAGTRRFTAPDYAMGSPVDATISCWLKEGTEAQSDIFGFYGVASTTPIIHLSFSAANQPVYRWQTTAGPQSFTAPVYEGLTVGTWHHWALVINGQANTAYCYLDGIGVSTPSPGTLQWGAGAGRLWVMGEAQNNRYLRGILNDCRVFNMAKPQRYIRAAYYCGSGEFGGLVATQSQDYDRTKYIELTSASTYDRADMWVY